VSLVLATTPLTAHREPIGAERVRAIVDAAADAGFAGVSIWTEHHDFAVADGMSSRSTSTCTAAGACRCRRPRS
jgi:hypothetical protein